MDLITIIFIAVGLAMDAFAVSISNGIISKESKLNLGLKLGFFFGGFQALMPILGWWAAYSIKDYIVEIDHWIAFVLLSFIGGKMIYEAFSKKENESQPKLKLYTILILSIATSIDALAVGITFTFLEIDILLPAIIIGVVSFIMSFIGVLLGAKFSKIFGNKIEVIGGLILISIGIKILIEHIYL